MQKHLTILGILHIAMGMMALAGVLFFFIVMGGFSAELQREMAASRDLPFDPIAILRGLLVFVGIYGGLELAAGIGILDRASWSRVLSMVLGAIGLISFPLGTALGVYTFWVMLDARTRRILEGEAEIVA